MLLGHSSQTTHMEEIMPAIAPGNTETIVIPANRMLEVSTSNEALVFLGFFDTFRATSDRKFRMRAPNGDLKVKVKATAGAANYTIFYSDLVPFTGDLELNADDNGRVFRCDDDSNVAVTVPANLPECFSVGFAMWGAGTITATAGSGATKRSSTSAISTRYKWGSLLVVKNADDASAEFVLGGDFA